jgi:hypothetical protein
MPYRVQVWVVDADDGFEVLIDKKLITEQGAAALQAALRAMSPGWQRLDEPFVLRALRAVTG